MIAKPRPTTSQEAFNNVWQHFVVEQHPRAVSHAAQRCSYRTHDNLNGCAIGCQLPDELADGLDSLPQVGITRVLEKRPAVAEYFKGVDPRLLSELQSAHDQGSPWTFRPYIKKRLEQLAKNFNLTVPT